jgi:hypothetical protein
LATLQTSRLILHTTYEDNGNDDKSFVAIFCFNGVLTSAQDTKLIELSESTMGVIAEHGPPGLKDMAKFILDHGYQGMKRRFVLHVVEIALKLREKERTNPALLCEAKGFTNLKDEIEMATTIAKQAVERFLSYMSGLIERATNDFAYRRLVRCGRLVPCGR